MPLQLPEENFHVEKARKNQGDSSACATADKRCEESEVRNEYSHKDGERG